MASLVLLSFDRLEIAVWSRRSSQGDQEAIEFFLHLWDSYADQELPCFLCDSEIVEHPPFTAVIGDIAAPGKAVGVPLCPTCSDLPKMLRWSRITRMLRKMHFAKTGRNLHYVRAPTGRGGRRPR